MAGSQESTAGKDVRDLEGADATENEAPTADTQAVSLAEALGNGTSSLTSPKSLGWERHPASTFPPARTPLDLSALFDADRNGFEIFAANHEALTRLSLLVDSATVIPLAGPVHSVDIAQLNLLSDAEFERSLAWHADPEADPRNHVGIDLAPEWHIAGEHTVYIRSETDHTSDSISRFFYHDPEFGTWVPVNENAEYQFRCLFEPHRCHAQLFAEVALKSGTVAQLFSPVYRTGAGGGRVADQYWTAVVHIPALTGAVAVRLSVGKSPTESGEDSYLFFARPWFGRAGRGHSPKWNTCPFNPSVRANLLELQSGTLDIFKMFQPIPAAYHDGLEHSLVLMRDDQVRLVSVSIQMPRTTTSELLDLDERPSSLGGLDPSLGGLDLEGPYQVSAEQGAESGPISADPSGATTPSQVFIMPAVSPNEPALVPPTTEEVQSSGAAHGPVRDGTIEVELPSGVKLRLRGAVDQAALRLILSALS